MYFDFTLKNGSRMFYMRCEIIYKSESLERFKVSARKNTEHYIILENNRPLIREKYGLKTKKLSWKVKEGNIKNNAALNETIAIIEFWLEPFNSTS